MARLSRPILLLALSDRLWAGLALAGYVATMVGLPLPASAVKDASQPFPCQDNPCGCRTAEECWSSCCCFSPQEHLAWARAHHVQPPAYAQRPGSGGWQTARKRDQTEHYSSCAKCQKPLGASKAQPCCVDPARPEVVKDDRSQTNSENRPHSWTRGVDVLRCQGLTTLWINSGATLPPSPRTTWHQSMVPAGSVSTLQISTKSFSVTPPDPPPRPFSA